MLLDCGLMFPDTDMLGIDLVLPDFTWLRERRRRHRRLHRSPTATRTTSAACRTCCASQSFPLFGSALTLGLARGRIEEAGLLKQHRADRRSATASVGDRPVRRRVHPRHPLGAPRASPRRSTPRRARSCTRGDFKIDLTPVDGRLTDLVAHRRPRRRRRHPPAAGRLHQRRRARATPAPRRASARCSTTSCTSTRAGGSSPPASPATSTASSRSPTPRIAFGRSDRRRSAARCSSNITMAREMGLLQHPRPRADRHRGGRPTTSPARCCVISTGSQGEPMSALTLLAASENRWLKLTPDDTVILSLAPHPRQRARRHQGDRQPRSAWVPRWSTPASPTCTPPATPSRGAQALPVDRQARVVRPGARRVPPPGRPRPAGRDDGRARTTTILVAEDGDRLVLDDDGLRAVGRVPAELHLRRTAPSATSAHGVLADRRILADEGVVAVIVCVDRKAPPPGGRPRDRHPGLDLRAGGRRPAVGPVRCGSSGAVETALAEEADRQPASRRPCGSRAGSFVADKTRRRPMIVPVVLDA